MWTRSTILAFACVGLLALMTLAGVATRWYHELASDGVSSAPAPAVRAPRPGPSGTDPRRPATSPTTPDRTAPAALGRPPLALRRPTTPNPPPRAGPLFHIVAGSTVADVLRDLHADERVDFDLRDANPASLLGRLGLRAVHGEGYFLAGNYSTESRRTASSLLREAHERMRTALADLWRRRDRGLPYTSPYDALIVASIVEKETARAEDRPRVAAVFTRRLQRGMRLQADPTVIYGVGSDYVPPLTRAHLATDTPYNTYTRHGLPPTPISLPGLPALQAAMHPAAGRALYFVARGDGSSQFSETLSQHNAAVRLYRQRAAAGP